MFLSSIMFLVCKLDFKFQLLSVNIVIGKDGNNEVFSLVHEIKHETCDQVEHNSQIFSYWTLNHHRVRGKET